jgi:hypothetical protein
MSACGHRRAPSSLNNKSIVERDAELLLRSESNAAILLHCGEFFASKNLKVDTMFVLFVLLFYGRLSRVSR